MMKKKYGDWALIAGASEGIGYSFAEEFAKQGIHLFLIARREDVLKETADKLEKKYSIETRILPLDLSGDRLIPILEEKTKDLDIGIVVYNAALSMMGDFMETAYENQVKVLHTNCLNPMTFAHYFGNRMVHKGKGAIILMSSLAGFQGSAVISHYAATKAYNTILAEGLWNELKDKGVDMLACCAGATNTPTYRESKPSKMSFFVPPIQESDYVARAALKYLGKGPSFIPGFWNRMASFILLTFFSRKTTVNIMSSNTRKMYG